MLGDSIRRRRPPPRPPRKSRDPRPRTSLTTRFPWAGWLLAALVVLVVSFLGGYLLATQLIFPRPETAGAGIDVPSLYGLDHREAEIVLGRAGLAAGTVTEMSSLRSPAGRVLGQSPVPGQQLRRGAEVALAVSLGNPQVRVPPTAGLGAVTARSMLEAAGFEVVREEVRLAGVAGGTIVRTDPEAGMAVRLPATVTMVVNTRPEPEVEEDTVGVAGWP